MDLTKLPYKKLKDLLKKVRATRSKFYDPMLGYGEEPQEKWWAFFRLESRILKALEIQRGREDGRANQQRFY